MNEEQILLAKSKLPPGSIDAAVGEAHIVRDSLIKYFPFMNKEIKINLSSFKKMEYTPPNGFKALVKLLEDKHQAPVVVTNGAKQALGASFYAMRKAGKETLGQRTPFWALIPPLAKEHGLKCGHKYDCYLSVLPNNPDGFSFDYDYAKYLYDWHRDLNIPFIHDAAYYTASYMPKDYIFGPLGDLQIYSASKSYGLSGARIGYVVCHNDKYYKPIQEYMETMTVGVSNISQEIFYILLENIRTNPHSNLSFEEDCRNDLIVNKQIVSGINPEILELPANLSTMNGMFLWAKVKNNVFADAKVLVADGKYFGIDGFVRINLGLRSKDLKEVVSRINSKIK